MFIRDCWYVAAWVHGIREQGLFHRTILGELVLLYRLGDCTTVALEERCCHRHAPLSLGKREGDCVRCGYHGLMFDPQGQCVDASGLDRVPPRACMCAYTLLVTLGDTLINNREMYKSLAYDPFKDFAHITQAVRSPAVISVNPEGLPAKNMADLCKLAATQRGKLTYGSCGPGGLGHLAGEQLSRTLDPDKVHVPQRGEAPVMADLLSKTVSLGLKSAGLAKEYVLVGKVNALAIMGRERSPALPQVPTLREQGFDDALFDAAVYIAFVAPEKTPEPVMKKLSDEIRRILADPEVGRLMNERGLEIMNSTPAEFAASQRT
jgi:tripartite-type tricarboxylate transporter receptor subunit TctC